MKKHLTILLSLFLLLMYQSYAQHNNSEIPTSINEDGAAPHASAILDLQSPDKGILIPRMDMEARADISHPAEGLMVYQVGDSPGFYFYDGTGWIAVTNACNLAIGDTHAGGIIFYLDGSGCHGLVAKATDELGTYQWATSNINTWAYAAGIYGGAQNTKKIIYRMGVGNAPAADQCEGLTEGGFTDWYLPSKDELDMMFVNLHLNGLGGFATGLVSLYWSSTEDGSNDAWIQHFDIGNQYINNKSNNFIRVRAIRAF